MVRAWQETGGHRGRIAANSLGKAPLARADRLKCTKAMCFDQTKLQMWKWFTRDPTESNPADEPSRLKVASAARRWQAVIHWPSMPRTLVQGN
eukprot:1982575-Amphidinium_carterae.2